MLHDYSDGWNGTLPSGEPLPGAKEFVEWLQSRGHQVYVQTARVRPNGNDGGAAGVRLWLNRNGFANDIVVTNAKIPAHIYIDDRGWRHDGTFEALRAMLESGTDPGTWQHLSGEKRDV